MANKPTTTIRIDPNVKKHAGAVFDEIGISMSAAINTFLKAVVREGTIPFDIMTSSVAYTAAPSIDDHSITTTNTTRDFEQDQDADADAATKVIASVLASAALVATMY